MHYRSVRFIVGLAMVTALLLGIAGAALTAVPVEGTLYAKWYKSADSAYSANQVSKTGVLDKGRFAFKGVWGGGTGNWTYRLYPCIDHSQDWLNLSGKNLSASNSTATTVVWNYISYNNTGWHRGKVTFSNGGGGSYDIHPGVRYY